MFNIKESSWNKNRDLWHMAFWVVYVLLFSALYGSFNDNYGQIIIEEMIELPVKILATYFTIYFLIPKFLIPKKYTQFFIYLFISVILVALAQRAMIYFITFRYFYPKWLEEGFFFMPRLFKALIYIYPVVTFAAAFKLFKHWYRDQKITQQLQQDKLEAELKFLKAQIHPHFLFNTLNNLYALTLKKSDHAPEVVLKLSELLSYMLYECNANQVPLQKEIDLIQTYIDLEKIRYGKRLEVIFEVKGSIHETSIAPMLLLPFVENSFKHGVSSEIDQAWVTISLMNQGDMLTLNVENSKSIYETKNDQGYKEGIGLKNVKRRLEILYKNQYNLDIFDERNRYLIVLNLRLK